MPLVPGTEAFYAYKYRNPVLNFTVQRLHTSVVDDLMSGAIYRTQGYNLNL